MKKRLFISVIVICLLMMPINCFADVIEDASSEVQKSESNYTPNVTVKYVEQNQAKLEGLPNVGCKAVYIAEPTTGKVIYEKNAHEVLYPASTTKILTALLTLENCKMDETAIVSKNAVDLVPDGYSNAKLQPGEELTIEDLLYALMLPSANEAANVLAEHISGSVEAFAELSNKRAKELGCEHLHFVNPNGIHDTNHVCTAYDLYLIAKECKKYDIFNEIVKTTSYTLPSTDIYPGTRTIKTTNDLLLNGTYYYEYCTGIKTGTTTPAGQCLVASSFKDDIELIAVVLGGATNANGLAERFYDTKRLFEYTYDTYSIKQIAEYGKVVITLDVGKAKKDSRELDVIVDTDISTIVPNDLDVENILTTVSIKDNIVAPIKENEVLGQITYEADGLEYTTNLIASHSVDKLPYMLYNAIIIGTVAFTIFIIFILLIKSKKRNRKKVLLIGIIILLLEFTGMIFIYKDGYKKSITKPISNEVAVVSKTTNEQNVLEYEEVSNQ